MFYEVKNQTEESVDLYIYGDIVSEKTPDWWTGEVSETDVDLKDFRETLTGLKPNTVLNLRISSGGGSVFAASTMVSMLKRAKASGVKIVAWIDGLAASAASFFPMVATETKVYRNSILMIHKPMVGLMGYLNSDELRKAVDELDALEDNIMIPLYEENSSATREEIKELVKNETWLGAEDISVYFPNFEMLDEVKDAAACVSDSFGYKNTPDRFKNVVDETEKVNEPIDYSVFDNIIKNLRSEENEND